MLKVAIPNCYLDDNKGSCAIAWGLINRLRATGRVVDISVISLFPSISPGLHYRHLTRKFPDVEVLPSPLRLLGERRGDDSSAVGRLVEGVRDTGYVSSRMAALLVPSARQRAARRHPASCALAMSDLVIERGGPFFSAMGLPPNPSLLRFAWPMAFARQSRIPYAFVGESVAALDTRWSRWFMSSLFERAALVGVRDPLSREVLVASGIPRARIKTMLDNAFWVDPTRSDRVEEVLRRYGLDEGRFLAVTCKELGPTRVTPYLAALARCIDELVFREFERVALVPNLYSPYGADHDDRTVTGQLYEQLRDKGRAVVVDEDLGPDELAALYGAAALVLGTRLHSIILALVGGSPVVAVAYERVKTHGVMQLLGLSDFVLDMDAFDPRDAVLLAQRAREEQSGTTARIARLRHEGDLIMSELVETIDGRH